MTHILVIDDEKSIRDVVKEALEGRGYKVQVACNGHEGLEYFNNSHRFKLVITDIKMPVMDGIELARSIRKSERSDIPVIAITAFWGNSDIERDLFDLIIGKPFNLMSLINTVTSYLES